MAFRVEIAPQAFDDLDSIADYIKERSSFAVAERWFNGVIDDIDSLKNMPARYPVASESEDLGREVHLLLHGRKNRTYKIYYSIEYETQSIGTVEFFTCAIGPASPRAKTNSRSLWMNWRIKKQGNNRPYAHLLWPDGTTVAGPLNHDDATQGAD